MRACRSTGISLTLLKKDKEEGERDRKIKRQQRKRANQFCPLLNIHKQNLTGDLWEL